MRIAPAVFIGIVVILLGWSMGAPRASPLTARPAAACPAKVVPPATRLRGARAVGVYHALRKREYAHDLMGFRSGPPLGSPSDAERRHIRASEAFRHTFRLNPSRLLIRRLLRVHGRGVDSEGGGSGVPLAAPELRDLTFRGRVEEATGRLARFQRRCAPGSSAGLYLLDRRAGVLVVARFTSRVRRRRIQMLRHFPYGPLLRVRSARFSLKRLSAVQERIERDGPFLRSNGIEVGATDVDIVHNRVAVEIRRAPPGAGRYLSHRYRGTVRVSRAGV